MKSESVIALVFRIAGLLLAVQSLAFIPSVLMATTTGTFRTEPTWPYVLPQVFGLVSGLIAAYVWRDLVGIDDLWQVALITLFYMGGAFIGARAFKRASEKLFRRVVLLSMLGLSIIGVVT